MEIEKAISALQYALEMERLGVRFYGEKADEATNPSVKDLFTGLKQMEESHVDYLSKILGHLKDESTFVDEMPPEESPFQKINNEDVEFNFNEIAALRMAMLLEHDFSEFYKKAAENTEDPVGKQIYLKLATWEQEHEAVIRNELDNLMKEHWYDMGFSPLV
jgi:rubrerythrin